MTGQEQKVQDIKETAPLNLTGLLSQKFTPQAQGVRTDQFKKQRLTRRVSQTMGRQRKKTKRKERRKPQKEC